MSYDKAYNEWDSMSVKERMSWCKSIGEECDIETASKFADELHDENYGFWTTIREILNEEY